MKKLFYVVVAVALVACQPKTTSKETPVQISSDNGSSQTISIGSPESEKPNVYHASRTILTDLINTKLEVSFDWQTSRLIGKETLTAKPHYYASNQLILDAKGMEIKGVAMAGKTVSFDYQNDILTITLDRTYTREENYTVIIDYIAKPEERKTGGSNAISSDKGLYFINPTGMEKNKMPQIWTQGETESNSVWFPTIDSPNAKTKQEIYITVDNKYVTLSNGKLISSIKNADGTRTDYWKQDLPHAPYLFMMGVGEFKVVKDNYTRPDGSTMEVNYYVEPEWENSARAIFGETPKMIGFFSKLLGVEYPWDKYHQIVVRDYVSGAMENTGAVIFGDFAYKNERELLDENDNSTIAHELFHHWFGDLVTCESWSNLTLNESFANYSQFLWDEHRYGLDEAEYQAIQEANGYFASADQGGYHNLVWFDYNSREDMFDGHSYNKGGRILHMLRKYIGDDAFFLALKNYLKANAYKPAEFHQLRLAFEEVCGEDLNWFFKQWYEGKGHPTLDISYNEDAAKKQVTLLVNQKQKSEFGLFKLPVEVTVYDDRGATTKRYWFNEESNQIVLDYVGTLRSVVFDAEAALLGKLSETKPEAWSAFDFKTAKHYIHRKNGLVKATYAKSEASDVLLLDALKDPFWDIRMTAVERLSKLTETNKAIGIARLKSIAKNDSVSKVRSAAIQTLASMLNSSELEQLCEEAISNDRSYGVINTALIQLSKVNAASAIKFAQSLENEKSSKMTASIATIYSKYGTAENMAFFEHAFAENKLQGFDVLGGLNSLTIFSAKQEPKIQERTLVIYEEQYKNGGMYAQMFMPQYVSYLRENALNSVEKLRGDEEKAKKDGNANAVDIAKGKRTEFEYLIAKFDQLLARFSQEGEK
jgi:aminopeptidase N